MKSYPNKFARSRFDRILVTEEFVESNWLSLSRDQLQIRNLYLASKQGLFDLTLFPVLYDYMEDPTHQDHKPIADIYEAAQDFLDAFVLYLGVCADEKESLMFSCLERLSVRLWLLGREDLTLLDLGFRPCGAPLLVELCERLGIPAPIELIRMVDGYEETRTQEIM